MNTNKDTKKSTNNEVNIDSVDASKQEAPMDYASENAHDTLNGTTSDKKAKANKKKWSKIKKAAVIIGGTILTFVVVLAATLLIMRITGKWSLYDKANSSGPDLLRDETGNEVVIDPENMGDVSNLDKEQNTNKPEEESSGSSNSNEEPSSGNSEVGGDTGSNDNNGDNNGSNNNNDNTGSDNNDSSSGNDKPDNIIQGGSGNDDADTVIYKGQKYKYNDDMITLLILGIDKYTPVTPAKNGHDGGQSDALFLVAMNPDTMVMDIIAIPRDTITKLWIYDKEGNFIQTGDSQICLQHGYGDGMELSNKRALEAVSYLMYDIPIHSVTSFNIGAISKLNDAVGGITLTSMETFSYGGYSFNKGETVTLKGDMAHSYIRYRDKYRHNTASERLARQKQYINLFIDKAKASIKNDIGIVTDVYNIVSKYLVTDLSLNEIIYLASESVSYKFGEFITLKGTLDMSGKYERLYLDETALRELIIEKFYEKVN